MSRGCLIGRRLRYVIGEPVADSATLTGLAADNERHMDGCLCVTLDTSSVWVYDTASTAPAGPTVLLSTYGPGRWLLAGGAATGADSAGAVNMVSVRGASTADIANLASFTVAGVDGLTYVEGERILLKDQTSAPTNGIYRCGVVAGGTCALTRVGEADASAEVTAGMLVWVSEGTAAGNEWYYLTTDDPIVLGTTNLVFAQVPSAVDFTSLETRLSTEECARSDTDSSVGSIETRVSTEECARSDTDSSVDSIETRLSAEECARSDTDSSVGSIETRVSTEECARSDTDSSVDSIETRVSTEECARSDTDSSVGSIETRVSTEECARSDTDSSVDSIETRLSTEECARSDTDSSVGSIETRVSTEECARSDTDSSVGSIETRLSAEECARSDTDSSVGSIETRLSVEESNRVLTALTLLATATITSADLTTAGVGPETENVGSAMSDNDIPLIVRSKLTDAFDNGAGVSLNMTVGWSGDNDRYITNFDCYTGSALENSLWEQGTPNAETQLGLPADSNQITAEFTCGGDTLANFSNGSILIEVWGLSHA